MQEIQDMCHLNQYIHTQTHKLGNTIDWLISNTANISQDITKKDYISDHSLIEWKFQIKRKPTEKYKNQDKLKLKLTTVNEVNFNIDLKKNVQTDIQKPSNKTITATWKPLKR